MTRFATPAPGPRHAARRGALGALVALALVSVSGASATDGPAPAFYGAKGPVALSIWGDGQTAFRMPSGVGWSVEHQIDLDVFAAYYRSTGENALNDLEKSGVGGGVSLGAVIAPSEDGPLRLHVGVYPELGAISPRRTRVRYTTFPGGVGQQGDTMFMTAAMSVVYTPASWVSVGASLHVIPAVMKNRLLLGGGGQTLALAGSPRIAGVPLPGDPTYADFLGLFPRSGGSDPTLLYEADAAGLHLTGLVSVTLRPTEDLAIGLAYRPRSWDALPFEGEATIHAEATVASALSSLDPTLRALFLATLPDGGRNGFTARYDLEQEGPYVPQCVRLSLAWWPVERLLVALEGAWTEWHRAFGSTTVTLSNGSNADFNFVVGSDRVVIQAPTRWSNRWTVSGSLAYRATDRVTLRGGFHFGESPINPKILGGISTPSFACTSVMAGAGVQLTPSVQANVLLEWVFTEREGAGVGTSALTTENTRYSSDQALLHLGLTCWF